MPLLPDVPLLSPEQRGTVRPRGLGPPLWDSAAGLPRLQTFASPSRRQTLSAALPAPKLTHLAEVRPGLAAEWAPLSCPRGCGSTWRRPAARGAVCLQTLIHSRDNTRKKKKRKRKKIKRATHGIPGTPARLTLGFSISPLSSSPWGGSLLGHLVDEKKKMKKNPNHPQDSAAPDKERGIAQEFPGRGVFVLGSSPGHRERLS